MFTKTNKKLKKIIAFYLVLSLIFLTTPMPVRAEAWGTNMAAAIWKQMTEEMVRKIRETKVALAKIMAIKTIQSKTENLLAGKGGSSSDVNSKSLVIENWDKEVWQTAKMKGRSAKDDYFKKVKQGVGPEGIKIIEKGEKSIVENYEELKPDIDKYVQYKKSNNPSEFFQYWERLSEYRNQPVPYFIRGFEVYQNEFLKKATTKLAEGIAGGGYRSVTNQSSARNAPANIKSGTSSYIAQDQATKAQDSEKITLPGSTVRDLNSKVHGMGIDTISMARSLPEIISSLVISMLTKLLSKGLGSVMGQLNGLLGGNGIGNILGNLGGIMGGAGGINGIGNILGQAFGASGISGIASGGSTGNIINQIASFIQGGGRSAKYFNLPF